MPLTPGSRFGTYHLVATIGRGGMGEVFRAHDSTLGRDVALKVLPDQFGNDPERRRRFEREAKALAALSHPNIAAIHGYEEIDGVQALVLELVDGETLADRLARGPLPMNEALTVGLQIAEALEAAHNAGIIHRDLKPANVKVRPDGVVKVLDFGLARTLDTGEISARADSPTITDGATKAGAVLGTAAYMSPEQARGLPVDKRTDAWAFGCVLYELITGSRAFAGHSATDVLVSVMREEPNWSALPPDTPAAVRRMLRRCLAKDARTRLRDLGDAQLDLREALHAPAAPDATSVVTGAGRSMRSLIWATVALVSAVAASVTGWRVLRPVPLPEPSTERLTIVVPAIASEARIGNASELSAVRGLTMSPDGRAVVYVGPTPEGTASRLYVRSLESYEPRPIDGTDGASAPFFSPDGQTVAFFAGGKLKRTSILGGNLATICDAPDDTSGGSGGAWGADDTIVFAAPTSARAGLFRVSAFGGAPQLLVAPDPADEGGLGDPAFIDGTDVVLFTTRLTRAGTQSSIVARSTGTGAQHKISLNAAPSPGDSQPARGPALPALSRPSYIRTGHLVFKSGSSVVVAPFRPDTLQVTGPVVAIAEEVADFSMSADGRLGYMRAPGYGGRAVWVDRQGLIETISDEHRFARPRLSPGGNEVALEVLRGGRSDIGLYRFHNRSLTLLTTDGLSNSPSWSPDGRYVVYRAPGALMKQTVNGTGTAEVVLSASDPALKSASSLAPNAFSPIDPSVFLFVVHGSGGTGADIFRLHLGPKRHIDAMVQRPGNQWAARMSPDGRWIAYASDESGRFEIYLEAATRGGTKVQVSSNGGSEVVWATAGNELFYRAGNRMMAVSIAKGSESSVGEPRLLFTGQYQRTDLPQYDVSRDSQRFLMIKPLVDEAEARTIRIVDGWVNELKPVRTGDARRGPGN